MKGGMLLLLLGIPFALYAAWQVNGAAHIDAGAPDAPADKTASKEQLAAASAKATAWSGEARKAVEVSWQYRAAGPADASADAKVTDVVKAASARAANLHDLDRFLSDIEKPKFTGDPRMQARYAEWTAEQASLRTDAQAVTEWLALPPKITSTEDADKAMVAVVKLIDAYVARSRFADKRKATVWRLRARLAVVKALTTLDGVQYKLAIERTLPLKPDDATAARDTLRGLKEQIAKLGADLKQAADDGAELADDDRKAAAGYVATAGEYPAREELLELFATPGLFTNANGAAPWLKLVAEQYMKTKDAKVQALIRKKVQEFADEFIPLVASLDDRVLVQNAPVPRKTITIKFEEKLGGAVTTKKLSDEVNGFNEFEIARKPPGFNQRVSDGAKEYGLNALKPTTLSEAAVAFNAARAKLTNRTTVPRWTAETVAELKKACELQKDLVDQLRQPDGTGPKIATRVAGLVEGMKACKELFEVVP